MGSLLGCSFFWHSQESEPIPHEEVSLVVIAPVVSNALRDELRLLACEASQHEPGIHRVNGLPFATWLVESDVMAERGQAVLSLVSRVFLKNRERIIDKLNDAGHGPLVRYMVQQFHTIRENFAVQHGLSDDLQEMEALEEELLTKILDGAPTNGEAGGGLSPEQRLAGISDEDAARLRELLDRKEGPAGR